MTRPFTHTLALTLCSTAAFLPTSVQAQVAPSGGIEVATDEARRGLSWSEGRAVLSADAAASLGRIDATARVTTLRNADLHAGADAVVDVMVATGWDLGAVTLRTSATGHLFAGARTGMDYAEIGASARYSYGPARLVGGIEFAPSQDALGGSNVYLYANADAGIPGTPYTLLAGIGHSSGTTTDPLRIQRLRPGGSYTDWRLGVERQQGPLTLGVDYIGTDIARADATGPFADARHSGDRIVARARLGF
jgi:hypothetical protein